MWCDVVRCGGEDSHPMDIEHSLETTCVRAAMREATDEQDKRFCVGFKDFGN